MLNKSVKYIIFLVIFTVFFDFCVGNIYDLLYFTEKSQQQDRLIHSAIGTSEDILIFGSSRAFHHYDPSIIEEKTGLSSFNVGYAGQNIYFHLALLKSAIRRSKPKVVILDVISIDFEKTNSHYDMERLSVLLPFMNKSNIYKDIVLKRGIKEKIKIWSSIYPFNSKILHIVRNNFTDIRSDVKGFRSLVGEWDKPIEEKKIVQIEFDPEKIAALYEFIELCGIFNIELHIFVSPHYAYFNGASRYTQISEELKTKYDIEINILENNNYFLERPELFADPFHLNADGAKKYTQLVAEIIRI